jgi:hypothetical protein
MKIWLLFLFAYWVVGIGCYIAILIFFPPTPLNDDNESDSVLGDETKSPKAKISFRCDRADFLRLVLVGFPTVALMAFLSPIVLLVLVNAKLRRSN